jgi:hypothetical protein
VSKFTGILPVGAALIDAHRRTDVSNVIGAIRDFSKASENYRAIPKLAAVTSLKIKISIRFTIRVFFALFLRKYDFAVHSFILILCSWDRAFLYRVSREECARIRENFPYVKIH